VFEALESRRRLAVSINELPIPTAGSRSFEITNGPDGDLRLTESGSAKIGQLDPTTRAIAEFPTPSLNSDPLGITAGPDGNL
jgi:virginiamycin B lyase